MTELRIVDTFKQCEMRDKEPTPMCIDKYVVLVEIAEFMDFGESAPIGWIPTYETADKYIIDQIRTFLNEPDFSACTLMYLAGLASRMDTRWDPLYEDMRELVGTEETFEETLP